MDPESALKMVEEEQKSNAAFYAPISGDSCRCSFTSPHRTWDTVYTIERATGIITSSIGEGAKVLVFDPSNTERVNEFYIKQDDGSFVNREDYDGPNFAEISRKFVERYKSRQARRQLHNRD